MSGLPGKLIRCYGLMDIRLSAKLNINGVSIGFNL